MQNVISMDQRAHHELVESRTALRPLIWVSRFVRFKPPFWSELITESLVTLSCPLHKNLSIILSICLIISSGVSNIVETYTSFGLRNVFMMVTLPNKDKPLKPHRWIVFWISLNLSWKLCLIICSCSHEKWIPNIFTPVHWVLTCPYPHRFSFWDIHFQTRAFFRVVQYLDENL